MRRYQTRTSEAKFTAIVGSLFLLGGVLAFFMPLGDIEGLSKFLPSLAVCALIMGFILLWAGRTACACEIDDHGFEFRTFRRGSKHPPYWRTYVSWEEVKEIRHYKRQNLLLSIRGSPGSVEEKQWVVFITANDIIMVTEESDGWLFGPVFEEFWLELNVIAKQKGIAFRVILIDDDHPRDLPEGLHVKPLARYLRTNK